MAGSGLSASQPPGDQRRRRRAGKRTRIRGVDPNIESEIERINSILPQTQCERCGFPGCRPYAEAMVRSGAAINRCAPGGERGIRRLAEALDRPFEPLDPACGPESPRALARIIAADCIGCTKCIQACPVDAIIGTGKRMHTVLPSLCTGCELCVAPCPTECIVMDTPPALPAWSEADALAAQARFGTRNARLLRERHEHAERLAGPRKTSQPQTVREQPASTSQAQRRAVIEAAMQRARERLAEHERKPAR